MSDTKYRCLILEPVGGVTIVRLRRRAEVDPGCHEHDYTHEVGEELYRLADGRGCERILLDLSNFETLSHPGDLAKLMEFWRRVKRSGGKLRMLCRPSGYREVFRITQLDEVFELYDDEREALNSIW